MALSTSEAEYMAASLCGQEVVYIRAILRDFGVQQKLTCTVSYLSTSTRHYLMQGRPPSLLKFERPSIVSIHKYRREYPAAYLTRKSAG